MTMQNPYWVNYRNLRENKKDRYMLGASLNYQILDWLNVSGRVRLDNSNNDYTEKAYASTNTQLQSCQIVVFMAFPEATKSSCMQTSW